jgi:hypothetical protein
MSLRPLVHVVCGSLALLILGALARESRGEAVHASRAVPTDTALNHWVFEAGTKTRAELLMHADEVVKHMKKAHPETTFVLLRERGEPECNRIHYLLETATTQVQRQFLDAYGQDEVCRALIAREDASFVLKEDVYLRLIASDPAKEQGLEPYQRAVVWKLDARFPRVGQAVECAERLARHLNATYPGFAFRAYDEWFPRSGGIRIYVLDPQNDAVAWEATEAQIRRDSVVRELLEGAADAFVEDSFEDTWLNLLAR